MRSLLLAGLIAVSFAANAEAGLILSTHQPGEASGTPLDMNANATSGPMDVTVSSNGHDFMAGWQLTLHIAPIGVTTGALNFNSAVVPPNYVFGSSASFSASLGPVALLAQDQTGGVGFAFDISNLLRMDFVATSNNTSGLFGIYAVEGRVNTAWTDVDGPMNGQLFLNVPDKSGVVEIGEVLVHPAAVVPEPSSLAMMGFGVVALAGIYRRRKNTRLITFRRTN